MADPARIKPVDTAETSSTSTTEQHLKTEVSAVAVTVKAEEATEESGPPHPYQEVKTVSAFCIRGGSVAGNHLPQVPFSSYNRSYTSQNCLSIQSVLSCLRFLFQIFSTIGKSS